jgi:UDP-N-acetylglucosamine 2-epimerase (non-hydrolysing)/GDP/UDP-N,N'-diacetylbacillosamine 2-epimerase (hydrolysing)
MVKRKICVVTGSRAEYGLLRWLMHDIRDDPRLDLQVVATGMHLAPEFGSTYQEIEDDGYSIDACVDMQLAGDSPVAITKSLGVGVIGFADTLERLRPDLMVILGDRFEILAAAQAAMLARIPMAHIHGGELTEGLVDDAIRHSLTKMSQLHFVAAEEYRKRVIQLGEEPNRVWNVGATGLDSIRRIRLLDRQQLSDALHFDLTTPYFIVTYHPVTLDDAQTSAEVAALFSALGTFPNCKIVITGVNADVGHDVVSTASVAFAEVNPGRVLIRASLGQERYLSAMSHADAVIGNSSSAIIEAPALKVPSVNIGNRQRGRIRSASVIDADGSKRSIVDAIEKARSSEFCALARASESLFGNGYASEKIVRMLAEYPLDGILMKRFWDLP